jgi:fluoroquinolone transport system permease protein
MNLRTVTQALGPIDIRSVRRDSLLSWMVLMPFVIAIFLRLAVPPLRDRLLDLAQFDLAPYFPVILALYFVLFTPMMFGMVIGFLLLDEQDSDTLTALQVSPVPIGGYALYRLAVPMLLSVLVTLVVFPLANLGSLPLGKLMLIAVAASPIGPMLGLFIAAFASNKVQGFALLKAVGGVLVLPVVAFFITGPWELAFGIFPTYWVTKGYWILESGAAGAWPYLALAIAYPGLLTAWLLRRFVAKLYR